MTTATVTTSPAVPSTLPDVHQQSFANLTGAVPARLQKAIDRVARESSETAGPDGISAFNSSI